MTDWEKEQAANWKKIIVQKDKEIERLRKALTAWQDACRVDATMEGPVCRVSHYKAQVAWKATADAMDSRREND